MATFFPSAPKISFLKLAHVGAFRLGHNDKVLWEKVPFDKKNINNFFKIKKLQHDPQKSVFIYSRLGLSKTEKAIFLRGLSTKDTTMPSV